MTPSSFLRKDRFRGKNGQPACYFDGKLVWKNSDSYQSTLSEDPSSEKIELVKYIPQGRFERLCNEHASGTSREFENELRNVIFSYIPIELRLNALDFDQLINKQESILNEKLVNLRNELKKVNDLIAEIEFNLDFSLKRNLEEKLNFIIKHITDLENMEPVRPPLPSTELSTQQLEALQVLENIEEQDNENENKYKQIKDSQIELSIIIDSTSNTIEKIKFFENNFQSFRLEIIDNLSKIGLDFEDIVKCNVNVKPLLEHLEHLNNQMQQSYNQLRMIDLKKEENNQKRKLATEVLNAPQKKYQEYLILYRQWKEKIDNLIGNKNIPESKIGIETKLNQISQYPSILEQLKEKRIEITKQIYHVLEDTRLSRSRLFEPIQNLISQNNLINQEYQLVFQSQLIAIPTIISDNIFSIIKQNIGIIRGEEESSIFVKNIFDTHGWDTIDDILSCILEIISKLEDISKSINKDTAGISPLLRKNKSSQELYNYLFGLEFLQPRYTLLFQNTPIEQLSPGQRGALLLIFYLLIDTNKFPIVLDQPEENLDNETIVRLLVPIIRFAKNERQIIMVTHNPNLAILCDAEQIIVANFDRSNDAKISYFTGSIENPKCNKLITDILEGTKKAFDNRSKKYFDD